MILTISLICIGAVTLGFVLGAEVNEYYARKDYCWVINENLKELVLTLNHPLKIHVKRTKQKVQPAHDFTHTNTKDLLARTAAKARDF